MQVRLSVEVGVASIVEIEDEMQLRKDERALENNAGHAAELAKMVKRAVTAIAVDMARFKPNDAIDLDYIVRVRRVPMEQPDFNNTANPVAKA